MISRRIMVIQLTWNAKLAQQKKVDHQLWKSNVLQALSKLFKKSFEHFSTMFNFACFPTTAQALWPIETQT